MSVYAKVIGDLKECKENIEKNSTRSKLAMSKKTYEVISEKCPELISEKDVYIIPDMVEGEIFHLKNETRSLSLNFNPTMLPLPKYTSDKLAGKRKATKKKYRPKKRRK